MARAEQRADLFHGLRWLAMEDIVLRAADSVAYCSWRRQIETSYQEEEQSMVGIVMLLK
ncbi:hypothetical protein QN362_16040 [Actimicrobium sp. CCC2.4]|uniref:hypothetical protein n=1 Tax=Actimicrobium sp. CCC2.4 TaxID=3048606 RepID=UPI002AC9B0D6|nr:hypothetical protein [Actimicrobium sp. CCC2.4]MEB0136849.1 hypothetical protein [Actimicrobium sp. CCC2.4]WPX33878.1 hypothetical protein RHM62_08735 [Actimicrobium sp. CCC2.4]